MDFRDVEELTEVNDAWPLLADLVDASPVGARVVARDEARSRECLVRLQVTARSALGGLAYNCGGIVIDHGWLRFLVVATKGCIHCPRRTTCHCQQRPPL